MVDPPTNQAEVGPTFAGRDQDWLAVMESLSDSITMIDRKGAVLFTNHQNCAADAEIAVGDSVYSQFQLSDQETFRRHVADVFGARGPVRFEMCEIPGGPSWSSFLLKTFEDAQQITRVVIIRTGITAQKLAQESLANSELQMLEIQKSAAIAQLAAGVGHEINNPLSVIQGYTELMLSGNHSEDVYLQLNQVLAASQRISKIVKELNQLARYTQPTKNQSKYK